MPLLIIFSTSSLLKISHNTSIIGRVQGSILSFIFPGKYPTLSCWTETKGRVMTILSNCFILSARIPTSHAKSVLPVPAGPSPKIRGEK